MAAVLIVLLSCTRYTLLRHQVLRALKVPKATPPCAPPIPLCLFLSLIEPLQKLLRCSISSRQSPRSCRKPNPRPSLKAKWNTIPRHVRRHPIAAPAHIIQRRLTCDTAQSVTSDPKSFASESVRTRWPVILVRPLSPGFDPSLD